MTAPTCPDWTTNENAPLIRMVLTDHRREIQRTIRELEKLSANPEMACEGLVLCLVTESLKRAVEMLEEVRKRGR